MSDTTGPTSNTVAKPKNRSNLTGEYVGEFLFVLVPLVVIAFVAMSTSVNAHRTTALSWFLRTEEWSFGAAVLFGQALQKMFGYNARKDAGVRFTNLFYVGLLVFGLIPTVVTNALVLNSGPSGPNGFLVGAQLFLFLLAAAIFLLVGEVTSTRIKAAKIDD